LKSVTLTVLGLLNLTFAAGTQAIVVSTHKVRRSLRSLDENRNIC